MLSRLRGEPRRPYGVDDCFAHEERCEIPQRGDLGRREADTDLSLDRRRDQVSREVLYSAIVAWIRHSCINRRHRRRLGKLSAIEFELALTSTPAASCSQPTSAKLGETPRLLGETQDRSPSGPKDVTAFAAGSRKQGECTTHHKS